MQRITCGESGTRYTCEESCCCPRCGTYNEPRELTGIEIILILLSVKSVLRIINNVIELWVK